MPNYYLLIKRDGTTKEGRPISALESARLLLALGVWPIWTNTRNRHAVCVGDWVAVYLSGDGGSKVIAKGEVTEIAKWSDALKQQYPLMLDGTPSKVLMLGNIELFPSSIYVKDRLSEITFINNPRKWGAGFMGGMRALKAVDFDTLTTHHRLSIEDVTDAYTFTWFPKSTPCNTNTHAKNTMPISKESE